MKELILDNILFIALICIIYEVIIFYYANQSPKLTNLVETTVVIFFLLCSPDISLKPFTFLQASNIAVHDKSMTIISAQLSVYTGAMLLAASRFRYIFSNSLILLKDPFLTLLILITLLSAFWSNVPIVTLRGALVLIGLSIVSAHIGVRYTWPKIYRIFLIVNTLILALSTIKPGHHPKGWTGIVDHPIPFGNLMALTSALWIMYAVYNPKQRRMAILFSVWSITAMQMANSAQGFVTFVVLLSLLIWLRFIKSLSFKYAFTAILVFMVVGIVGGILIIENLENIANALGKDMTLTGRTEIWASLAPKIQERFWLGYGLVGFWQPWKGIDNPAYNVRTDIGWLAPNAHQGFLEIWISVGLIGLILFFLSFLRTVFHGAYYLSKSKIPEAGLPLVLLTFLLMANLTESQIYVLSRANIWCYYILTVAKLSSTKPLDLQRF